MRSMHEAGQALARPSNDPGLAATVSRQQPSVMACPLTLRVALHVRRIARAGEDGKI